MDSKTPTILTGDGSSTLYSEQFGDHYHSTHGALRESQHIFIDQGLHFKLKQSDRDRISILEVGMGTGLNVLLTSLQHQANRIRYTALEPYPLKSEIWKKLNYPELIDTPVAIELFHTIHGGGWTDFFTLSSGMHLRKLRVSLQEFFEPQLFDIIYFDAFSPVVQSEMWSEQVFTSLYQMCRDGAVLVTYSSKGSVRRALKNAGFSVTKIPGPVGKREIVRAIKD